MRQAHETYEKQDEVRHRPWCPVPAVLAEEADLRAQITALTAERDAMRKVVDAAVETYKLWHDPLELDEELMIADGALDSVVGAYIASQEPPHDRPDEFFSREQIDRLKYLAANQSTLTVMERREMDELVKAELEASIRRTEAQIDTGT